MAWTAGAAPSAARRPPARPPAVGRLLTPFCTLPAGGRALPIVPMAVNWEKVCARLKSIFISQFLLISYVVAATIALAWPAPGKAVGSVQVGRALYRRTEIDGTANINAFVAPAVLESWHCAPHRLQIFGNVRLIQTINIIIGEALVLALLEKPLRT